MMPRVCLQFVSVVFPDHTHYFLNESSIIPDPRVRTELRA